jgi:uncharacterized damage-inducible protein DinB
MKEDIIKGFEETTKELFTTLSWFTQEEFNKIPFEGSWTAGQVAEHLYKSESHIVRALNGNAENTDRDAFQHTQMILKIFLDYTTKRQSPEFILPSNEPKDKEDFIKKFEETRKNLQNLIDTKDLTRTYTGFSFPGVGHLTGWECLCFVYSHSKRHIRQMKNIAERLKAAAIKTEDVE